MTSLQNTVTFTGVDNDEDENQDYVPKLSLLEEQYMEKARQRQKDNIVKPQIVAGREFKGVAFISKPDKIIFKDFTLGIPHSQTILVTNGSFSFNSFKLLPLPDSIKDFFHIQYTPTGRMSAGLSTTITITFTPQLAQDIDSYLPLLSETGPINIPLICTCKKALVSVEDSKIDFGNVIYGEQSTKYLRVKNTGALPTKVFVKTREGKTIPFVHQDELNKRIEEIALKEEQDKKRMEEEQAKLQEEPKEEGEGGGAQEDEEFKKEPKQEDLIPEHHEIQAIDPFEEFLAQVQFKRTSEIEGYSQMKIAFTFVPYKLGKVYQDFTLYLENQDYTEPIPITIGGECVDVPIYVEKEEYNLNILVYEQFYREKVILLNRSNQPMKIQLFFPKSFKPYLEFNPTLGYIQSKGKFEIWSKFKPDRTILTNCRKYLVKQDEDTPPKDPYEEFTMRIPIKVTGANQVLPVKFSMLCVFTVNSITFNPPNIDFGNVFNKSASRFTITMENHALLPQQFSFVRLPREISILTDSGTGNILPNEKYKIEIEYRPSQPQCYDEANIFCRMITGNICARELKIPYTANVIKSHIVVDKQKIEFPALPENENKEVVLEVKNVSQKNYLLEVVCPNYQLSGLMVNPLVIPLAGGRSSLLSIKYHSKFREFTPFVLEDLYKPKEVEGSQETVPKGMIARNKKLAERLEKKKNEQASAQAVDPKKKGGPPPAAAKKEEVKKETAPPAGAKGKQNAAQLQAEQEAEEERKRKEAEEAEAKRKEEIMRNFDKEGELKRQGGKVYDFFQDDEIKKSQHYEWLVPIYFKNPDKDDTDTQTLFLQARTVTVKRTLVPNVEHLEFGEIPVAFKKTQEILLKNIGYMEETLRMEALTPFGGFSVLNALRTIKPGETKPIVVQFEPFSQQIYEEKLLIYSNHTVVSIELKGTGVRPEVTISLDEGLMSFGNLIQNEQVEKSFNIKNISSFPVNFELVNKAFGVDNKTHLNPFTLIPAQGTIKPQSEYPVKILFQPDHPSNHYFQVLLLDIPNQVQEKNIYLKGWCYNRQVFAREYEPFEWKPIESMKKRYEEPLKVLSNYQSPQKQRITLEFLRDEEANLIPAEQAFEKEKNRFRKILVGSCRMMDIKMEKNGSYEVIPGKDDKFFECDNLKGALAGNQEVILKFTFKPPQSDPIIKDIDALKGIGQWVESMWELKLQGGYAEAGQPDVVSVEVLLRAYVEQI